MNNNREKWGVCAVIISDSDGRILLQKKDSGYHYAPNKWSLIGGGIEEGETKLDAMKREINEELGIEIRGEDLKEIGEFMFEGVLNQNRVKIHQNLFTLKFEGKISDIRVGEGAGFAFFEIEELPTLDLMKPTKEVLDKHFVKGIPVCKPWLCGKEKEYVNDALNTNWISSSGEYIEKFEEGFSKFCDAKYGVSCSSGFGALHLACVALGLKKDDEVIVPTFTMAASTNAIILTGAKPVLVDCDKETFCIDVDKIEEKITDKTKAIMVVHIYGHPCEMDGILELAAKYNLFVIEDAAEAHGAEYKGRKVGSIGDIGCFSFYANKILTTGEGGMCITNNNELAEKMRKLKNHGFEPIRFVHNDVGFNYKITNLQAAIGCAQVENAERLVEARRNVGLQYKKELEDAKGLILPVEKEYAKNVYWMFGVVLSKEVKLTREEVMQKLKERGVDTRTFFIPMHKQPMHYNKTVENAPDCSGEFPNAELIGERGFYIPSSSNLTKEEIDIVCRNLKDVLSEEK